MRETLAKDQFVDAHANSDMRLRIKQARPVNLNDAVRHAVELEAYFKAEGKLRENRGYIRNVDVTERSQPKETDAIHSMLDELRQSMKQLEEKMKSIQLRLREPLLMKRRQSAQTGERTSFAITVVARVT